MANKANNKKIKGLNVEISADTTKLAMSLEESKKKSQALRTELRQVERLLKMDPGNVELLAQKQKILADQVDETKKRLSLMKEEQEKVNQLFKNGEIGEADYRKYQREVEQTRIDLEKLEGQLKETGDKFSEVQRKSGAVNFRNAEDKAAHLKGVIKDMADSAVENMEKVSKTAENVGEGLEKAGSVLNKGSAAAAAVLAGSVASFKDLDNGYDIIVKKTGATEDAFDSLKATADEIFSGSVFDMSDIGAAIGEVNTCFGYTGKVLRSVSEQYLQFAKINDADVSDSVAKTARIMQAWDLSAENLPDLLGMITAKGQETGVAVSALMDKVLDNNAIFKEMGLSLEESISLMAQFEKNGINDSTALMALKTSVKNATKEGKSLSEALAKSVSDIKNATTDTEALQKATELFGTRGAAEMAVAIREGRIDFDKLSGSMTEYKDTVKKTYTATLDPLEESKQVLNNLKLAGADLAATALKEGKPLIDDVVKGIKGITDWFKKLDPEQKKVLTKAIEITAVVGPGVTILGKLTKGVGGFVGTGAKLIKSLKTATTAQEGLNAAQSANPIGAVVTAVVLLTSAIVALDEAHKAYLETQWEASAEKKYVDEVEAASEKLQKTSDAIVETTKDTFKKLEDQTVNNSLIDTYQEELNKLLGKSELTDQEKSKLNTIVQYLTDNVQGFAEAWDKYTIKDKSGNIRVVGELSEVQDAINKTIDDFQRLAMVEALRSQYSELTKESLSARMDYGQQSETIKKLQDRIDEKLKESGLSSENFIELYKIAKETENNPWLGAGYTGRRIELLQGVDINKLDFESLTRMYDSYIEATKQAKEAESTLRSTASLTAQIADLLPVLESANYDDPVATLMAYNANLLTNQQIEESRWKSLENLQKAAAETGKSTRLGVEQDMTELEQELYSGQKTAEESLNERLAINKKYMGDTAKGATEAVKVERPKIKGEMSEAAREGTQQIVHELGEHKGEVEKAADEGIAKPAKKGVEAESATDSGKNFVSGFINGMKDGTLLDSLWNAAKNIGSTALNAIKNMLGIHSPSKEAEKLGSFFGRGFTNGIAGEKRNAAISAEHLAESARNALQNANIYDFDRLTAGLPGYISDSANVRDQSGIIALSSKMDVLIDKMDAIARKEQGIYLDGNILVGRTVERMDNALYNRAVNRERGV